MDWSLFYVVVLIAAVQAQETCRSADETPYLLFGTKTAYNFAKQANPNFKMQEVRGCQPTAIWLLNRHGSHNPEANEIIELQKLSDLRDNIVNNYKNGNYRDTNMRICSADLNMLQRWEWKEGHNLTFAGDLTSDGYMTTQQIAQDLKQIYPNLLLPNRHDYLFKFVDDQRSSNTFRAFTEGLFGAQAEGVDVSRENDEKLLRPYKFCPTWTKEVEENNNTLLQRDIFESKMEFQEMINNISLRLGFNHVIQKEIVYRIYQICRYNKAWNYIQLSPWCAAFTKEDLKRLEYAEDLETYYKYGYGSELNQKIGCTLVKDMMDFFVKHTEHDEPQQPRAMIHFTEAPMVLMTLTAMGLHQDSVPLTGDNYHTNNMQNRKWTSSTLAPFNANLAAVLYKCTLDGNFQINEQYQILFLQNQRPIYWEGCKVGLCDWTFVKKKFADVTGKCDLEFCNSATKVQSLFATFAALVIFLVSYY